MVLLWEGTEYPFYTWMLSPCCYIHLHTSPWLQITPSSWIFSFALYVPRSLHLHSLLRAPLVCSSFPDHQVALQNIKCNFRKDILYFFTDNRDWMPNCVKRQISTLMTEAYLQINVSAQAVLLTAGLYYQLVTCKAEQASGRVWKGKAKKSLLGFLWKPSSFSMGMAGSDVKILSISFSDSLKARAVVP